MIIRTVRVQKIPESEIEIGRRLRAFREASSISRTAFATSIGIGSERLASYEAGRVPLRYEVASRIYEKYSVNLGWLATGKGLAIRFDLKFDKNAVAKISPKQLLSEVYQKSLRPMFLSQRHKAIESFNEISPALIELRKIFLKLPIKEREKLADKLPRFRETLTAAIDELDEIDRLKAGQERMNENLRQRGLAMSATNDEEDWHG